LASFFNVATGDGLDDLEQLTQEFRLPGSPMSFWQTGFYYFDEELTCSINSATGIALVNQQTTSWALFGQTEYQFTDAWP
jgi:iron complex outermembrane receptor protein